MIINKISKYDWIVKVNGLTHSMLYEKKLQDYPDLGIKITISEIWIHMDYKKELLELHNEYGAFLNGVFKSSNGMIFEMKFYSDTQIVMNPDDVYALKINSEKSLKGGDVH